MYQLNRGSSAYITETNLFLRDYGFEKRKLASPGNGWIQDGERSSWATNVGPEGVFCFLVVVGRHS